MPIQIKIEKIGPDQYTATIQGPLPDSIQDLEGMSLFELDAEQSLRLRQAQDSSKGQLLLS